MNEWMNKEWTQIKRVKNHYNGNMFIVCVCVCVCGVSFLNVICIYSIIRDDDDLQWMTESYEFFFVVCVEI